MPLRICVAAFLQRSSQSVKLEVVLKPLSFPPVYSHMFTALARCSVLLFLFLACVACKPKEEISTYTTERTSAPRPPFNKEEVASQLDHTLAAMLPVDKTVWFSSWLDPLKQLLGIATSSIGFSRPSKKEIRQRVHLLGKFQMDGPKKDPPKCVLLPSWSPMRRRI